MNLSGIFRVVADLWQRKRTIRVLVGRSAATWLAVGAIAGLLAAAVEVVLAVQIAHLLAAIGLTSQSVSKTIVGLDWTLSFIVVGIGVVRALSYFLIAQSGTAAYESILLRLRLLAFHETFLKETGYVSLARLSYLLADVFPRATQVCLAVAVAVPSVIQIVIVSLIMFLKSWLLTLLGGAGIVAIGIIVVALNIRVRKIASTIPPELESMSKRVNSMARNWFFLRVVRKIGDEERALANLAKRIADLMIRCVGLGNFASVLPQSLGVFVLLLLFYIQSEFQPIAAVAFVAFLYLFVRLIQSLGNLATQISAAAANFSQFFECLDFIETLDQRAVHSVLTEMVREAGAKSVGYPLVVPESSFPAPSVEFSDVAFEYGPGAVPINGFSMRIRPGEHVAIMGPSGSGKSTILALCLGVLRPSRGKVLVDSQSPQDYLRSQGYRLGYVGAEPFIVAGTVGDNLCYGLDRACAQSELMDVLVQVGLGEWASVLVKPLDHLLREGGEGMSTGQKARLMLARALLRRPTLLVLDEMSANLDRKSELEIKDLIFSLEGCTILTVSHRAEFVNGTHRIIEL